MRVPGHRILTGLVMATIMAGAQSWAQATPPEQAGHEVLTNDSVVSLVEAGLNSETIVAKIRATANRFDTSTGALVALKKSQVPDAVITEMVAATGTSSSAGGGPSPITPAYYGNAQRQEGNPMFTLRPVKGHLRLDGTGLTFEAYKSRASGVIRMGERDPKNDKTFAWAELGSWCVDDGPKYVFIEFRDRNGKRLLRLLGNVGGPLNKAYGADVIRLMEVLGASMDSGFSGLSHVTLEDRC